MGLDIGAVQIKYMERPGGVALKFASYLAANSHEAAAGKSDRTETSY